MKIIGIIFCLGLSFMTLAAGPVSPSIKERTVAGKKSKGQDSNYLKKLRTGLTDAGYTRTRL